MRIEIVIILVTAFFIANTYYDGKYITYLKAKKKYFEMGLYGLTGVVLFYLFKKNPKQSKEILLQANDMIKYMPIDKDAMSVLNPIIDFTKNSIPGVGPIDNNFPKNGHHIPPKEGGMLNSGRKSGGSTKRSVGETKKKWVASQQNWHCGKCNKQLNAWFEVDHKIRLEYGGSNHVNNLVALCRECHGEKTARERLEL